MRVEQKVHERGFLCVILWVCNEQSHIKSFSEMTKENYVLAKVLAKVHVDMSNFALQYIYMYCLVCMFHFAKTIDKGSDAWNKLEDFFSPVLANMYR